MTPLKGRKDKTTETTNKDVSEHSKCPSYLTAGETKSWSVVHNGIEYRGEVIVADSWQPRWATSGKA